MHLIGGSAHLAGVGARGGLGGWVGPLRLPRRTGVAGMHSPGRRRGKGWPGWLGGALEVAPGECIPQTEGSHGATSRAPPPMPRHPLPLRLPRSNSQVPEAPTPATIQQPGPRSPYACHDPTARCPEVHPCKNTGPTNATKCTVMQRF